MSNGKGSMDRTRNFKKYRENPVWNKMDVKIKNVKCSTKLSTGPFGNNYVVSGKVVYKTKQDYILCQ